MLADLTDKRALVTGAASGIGLAIAALLTERGARVMLADIDSDGAAKAAAGLPGAASVGCDVTDEASVEAAVAAAVEAFGGLDIVVNNAGIAVRGPLLTQTVEEFDAIFAVNVKGVFLGIKHGAPALRNAGGGAIVNTASVAGLGGAPSLSTYGATKGAVLRLTETAALELRPAGIRVNAVCPGFIDTPMLAGGRAGRSAESQAAFDAVLARKQGRLGTPEEIAEAVAFLASDDARFITGAHFLVDNGLSSSLL